MKGRVEVIPGGVGCQGLTRRNWAINRRRDSALRFDVSWMAGLGTHALSCCGPSSRHRVAAWADGSQRWRRPEATGGMAEVRRLTQRKWWLPLATAPAGSCPWPSVPPATGPVATRRVTLLALRASASDQEGALAGARHRDLSSFCRIALRNGPHPPGGGRSSCDRLPGRGRYRFAEGF